MDSLPIARNRQRHVYGATGHVQSVYIDDLVRGIYQSAMSEGANGEIFNLSGPEQVTNQTYFNYLAQAQGKKHVTVVNLSLVLKLTGFMSGVITFLVKPPISIHQLCALAEKCGI